MGSRRSGLCWILVVLMAWGPTRLSAQQPQSPDGLAASILMAQTEFGAEDAIEITFRLANTTNGPLRVLDWLTPLEGFRSDMFVVSRQGRRIPYRGALVKRALPRHRKALRPIPAGGVVERTLDLTAAYALEEEGAYTVRLDTTILSFGSGRPRKLLSQLAPVPLVSGTLHFELTERRTSPPPIVPFEFLASDPAPDPFGTCGNHSYRLKLVKQSLVDARDLASKAKECVDRGPNTERFRTWFGRHGKREWESVRQVLTGVEAHVEDLTFDCAPGACGKCRADDYAYVYSWRPFEVCLCREFWLAASSGRSDSRAGTLIHELTHFDVVAGLDDGAVRGVEACLERARHGASGPLAAPDCYQYFAESVPPKSCSE